MAASAKLRLNMKYLVSETQWTLSDVVVIWLSVHVSIRHSILRYHKFVFSFPPQLTMWHCLQLLWQRRCCWGAVSPLSNDISCLWGTHTQTHTHTRLTALCPGLPGWAGTKKVRPIWILLKQETVRGSGISWAICKSAPRSRQTTTPATHHSVFYRPDALPAAQPTASKHWRHDSTQEVEVKYQKGTGLCPLTSSSKSHLKTYLFHSVVL